MKQLGKYKFTKVYIDDVLILSLDKEIRMENLGLVSETPRGSNVSINFDKSTFCKLNVKYLGNIVDKHRIKADLTPLSKIHKILPPNRKKEIMRIIRVLQWFRPHLINPSQQLLPITELLKTRNNTSKLQWKNKHTETV